MRHCFLLLALLLFITNNVLAQVGIGTITPAATAQLDVSSTNKGLLPPRMTSIQRKGITNPAEGLVVYDLDLHSLTLFDGSKWVMLGQKQDLLSDAPGEFGTVVANTQGTCYGQAMVMGSDHSIYIAGEFFSTLTFGSNHVNAV